MMVSVVVVNYNGGEILRRCLASIAREDPEYVLETILVDNASRPDDLDGLGETSPVFTLLRNAENVGFARATNQGIAVARGEFILLLNNDAELRPGALHSLVEAMEAGPRIGIVGPRVLNPDGSLQLSYARFPSALRWLAALPTPKEFRHYERAGYESGHRVEWLSGCCLLVRRQMLEELGGLDEQFFFNFEDIDLCKRAHDAGWRCWYAPSAQVMHYRGASSVTPEVRERILLEKRRSQLLYFRKHGTRVGFMLIKGITLLYGVLGLCWSVLGKAFSETGADSRQAFYRRVVREVWMVSR